MIKGGRFQAYNSLEYCSNFKNRKVMTQICDQIHKGIYSLRNKSGSRQAVSDSSKIKRTTNGFNFPKLTIGINSQSTIKRCYPDYKFIYKVRFIATFAFLFILSSCAQSFGQQSGAVRFVSSDTALTNSFAWAKHMALHYQGKPGDPVGPWYESALPPRNAFCMRDVSHQSIGGAILGMDLENKNMMTLFVSNISEGKDWCSFWEMNKEGKPAPEDYRNDSAFWYNLPANFDVMSACWRLYKWTGDRSYITDHRFTHFFDKSVTDYIAKWVLQPDSLLTRPTHPDNLDSYDENDAFKRCRGLPSYSEGVRNIKMGADLVAAIYRGLMTYGELQAHNDKAALARRYYEKAKKYQQELENKWWDNSADLYNTYYSDQLEFGKTEGETFLLWFDALSPGTKKTKTISHLLSRRWNVENMSYQPLILYRNGYHKEAYEQILYLTSPNTKRREYPEVSFGVVEAIVQGLMGIEPDATTGVIATCYNDPNIKTSRIEHLPILRTSIDLSHFGADRSEMTNNGHRSIMWRAEFKGTLKYAEMLDSKSKEKSTKKAKKVALKQARLPDGRVVSYVDVRLEPGSKIMIKANIN